MLLGSLSENHQCSLPLAGIITFKEKALKDKKEFFNTREQRFFNRLAMQIFGKKTIYNPKTLEKLKDIGLSLPFINFNGSTAWISESGKKALTSLSYLFVNHQKYSEYLYLEDAFSTIKYVYEKHLGNNNIPSSDEFFGEIIADLDSLINEKTFVGTVEGIIFKDLDCIDFGEATLKKFDGSILKYNRKVDQIENSFRKKISDELKNKIVFVSSEKGSMEVAVDKYKQRAKINLSVLKVLICADVKGGFTRTHINLKSSKSFQYQDSSLFGWSSNGHLYTSGTANPRREFPLTTERFEQLNVEGLFEKLSYIANKNEKNELEQAIEKSLYWFSEAQSDGCQASSFLKLWSCLECFFSITSDEITERNARGVASLFMYGDINMQLVDIAELQNYASLKSTVKKYYQLRSAVVHRAEYKNIDEHVTVLLSYIVCSVILSIACLASRGHDSLDRIAIECERLDKTSHTS
tara:strand:- start:11811 stop:13208 length:1398 start_codon:yes stop_codon:yes gene_type:complete